MLGLGLGYELREAKNTTSKPVIVIEKDLAFYHLLKDDLELFSNVKVCFGDEYCRLDLKETNVQRIVNDNLIQCDP